MTNPLALERKIRKLATVQNYGDEILMKLTLTSHRVVVGSKGLLRVYAIRMAGWVNRTWVGRIGSAYLPMATLISQHNFVAYSSLLVEYLDRHSILNAYEGF